MGKLELVVSCPSAKNVELFSAAPCGCELEGTELAGLGGMDVGGRKSVHVIGG